MTHACLFHIFMRKRKLLCGYVLTCFMAVTVITKNRGRPLVTGEVGVSIINFKEKYKTEFRDAAKLKKGL